MRELEPPMHRAVELAWESFCAGSLGIGAVITLDGELTATGRNRLAESDPGDDALAGTSLAHAEMNALAKLRWGATPPGMQLWTTLQPCLQCLGAIRLSAVRHVHVLAPDPLFRGVERARELNEFIGRDWPAIFEFEVDEWSAFSLLLQTHVTKFWGVRVPGWNEAIPSIEELAEELVASGRLLELAASDASVDEVGDELGPRLAACVPDVAAVAAM
ncbi:MAG TPA: nucleoside deaminase [Acidimicrobiales bacterium]|nr:nucleoside deaminase [Acidimicrobiales bacterium]